MIELEPEPLEWTTTHNGIYVSASTKFNRYDIRTRLVDNITPGITLHFVENRGGGSLKFHEKGSFKTIEDAKDFCWRDHIYQLSESKLFSPNPIWEIYKLFPNYKSYKDSLDYDYLRGTSIIKWKFKEALDEIGIDLPESITGYKYI